MLQAGSFPFADALLQSIRSQQAQMEQGQVPEAISPELMEQVRQGVNPDTMKLLQRTMGMAA